MGIGKWTGRAAALAAVAALTVPAAAHGESVAYVDGNEVWVSTLDGARKTRLSAGENQWRDVAHASDGHVVGVKLESGKIAQLSFFSHWGPAGGAPLHQGILPNDHVGSSLAAPLNIDLAPGGLSMVWGFSAYTYAYPVGTLVKGTYYTTTENQGGLKPLVMSGEEWPSLAGRRLVSASGREVRSQNDIPSAPFSNQSADWTPWLDLAGVLDSSWDLTGTATSADGTRAAFYMSQYTGGSLTGGKIGVVGTSGLGQAMTGSPDCWLPVTGIARGVPSISADGAWIAWHDDQGVKVAPMPTGTADPCQFPAPPVLIAAGGSHPDLGGFNVPAGTTPGAPGTTPPPATTTTTAPAALRAAAFVTGGVRVAVTPNVAGRVRIIATLPGRLLGLRTTKPVVVGTATRVVGAGARTTFVVRPLAKYRTKIRRLAGKRVTLRITVGSRTIVRTVLLRR